MKLVSVVGARPQFIKLAPLSRELRSHFTEVIVHTGQHYSASMSDRMFADLEIPRPDHNLEVGSGGHGAQTGRMLAGIEAVLLSEQPDGVIVFGDTNSTVAGALAAAKLGIPLFHVEAGLRSFNRSMPEEINRVAADHLSDHLFAPTAGAMVNLEREGLASRATLTGDIMVDTLVDNVERAARLSTALAGFGLERGGYSLLTLHRPFNVDDPLRLAMILDRLAELGEPILFPAHPRTRATLDAAARAAPSCIRLIEPQGYLDFLQLQSGARRIITDSGGVQKEAYLLRVPCITLRPETEWVETVAQGWNLLADPSDTEFVEKLASFRPSGTPAPVFGGEVAGRMNSAIAAALGS